jgi:hypothetical protein
MSLILSEQWEGRVAWLNITERSFDVSLVLNCSNFIAVAPTILCHTPMNAQLEKSFTLSLCLWQEVKEVWGPYWLTSIYTKEYSKPLVNIWTN